MPCFCCGGSDAAGEKKSQNENPPHSDNISTPNPLKGTPTPNQQSQQDLTAGISHNNNNHSSSSSFAVMSFGHPLLDMISQTSIEFLDKYNIEIGSSNLVKPEQIPIFKDMASHPENVQYVAGGAAMNTARIARWLLKAAVEEWGEAAVIEKLGGNKYSTRTCMVGAVGNDEFEGHLRTALKEETVDNFFFQKQGEINGTCAVLVVEGERSLLANLGAATKLMCDDICKSEDVQRAFDGTKVVYMEGFFMNLTEKHTSVTVAKNCTERGKVFAFNLSAPYLCFIFPESLQQILPHVDILFGSRIDAVAYGKQQGWEEASDEGDEDLEKIVQLLVTRIPRDPKKPDDHRRTVVITDGSNATVVGISCTMAEEREKRGNKGVVAAAHDDDEVELPCQILKFYPERIHPDSIVDSNGAGDAFAGGFICGRLFEYSIDKAVALGHASANVILRHSGCTFPAKPPFKLSQIEEAAKFSGSLLRRPSMFAQSLRRKSEATSERSTNLDSTQNGADG